MLESVERTPARPKDPGHSAERPLRVLALTGHPIEAAGARYRVIQFIAPLRQRGLQVDHQSFFSSEDFRALYEPHQRIAKLRALVMGTLRRSVRLAAAGQYDVILIHHWLHPITFPPFDLALRALGIPVVYDFDDAFYAPVGSPADRLRDAEWTVRVMRVAHTVITGSDYIRKFVSQHNASVEVLPTAVDTDRFTPRDFAVERNPRPVVGWVGSHSTAPLLEPLYPVIERLARDHDFVLRIVGGPQDLRIPGVTVECEPWRLSLEVEHFRQLDIGLYPLNDSELSRGKHGFKLHQYMAVGVPTVASAAGLNPTIVRDGENAFLAETPDQWSRALSSLIRDEGLRRRVGGASRAWVDAEASVRYCADRLATILRRAADSRFEAAGTDAAVPKRGEARRKA
jgi:glycosyltransferase involved in cell wall biosynthesis